MNFDVEILISLKIEILNNYQLIMKVQRKNVELIMKRAPMTKWLHCSTCIDKVLCSNFSILKHQNDLGKVTYG